MIGNKKDISQLLNEHKVDIRSYSNVELTNHIQSYIEEAVQRYDKAENGINHNLALANHADAGGRQNWAIIQQNEITRRQNERIIQLLESLASAQGVVVPDTCPNCSSTIVGNTAFCSQCGHKLEV